MMAPYKIADKRNGQGRENNGPVSENSLLGEGWYDFGDGPHGRKDHNVNRWVGIEPEHMLPQDRVAGVAKEGAAQIALNEE